MFLNLLGSHGLDGLWSDAPSISDGIFNTGKPQLFYIIIIVVWFFIMIMIMINDLIFVIAITIIMFFVANLAVLRLQVKSILENNPLNVCETDLEYTVLY